LDKDQAINYAQNRATVGEENRLRVKLPPTSDFGVTRGPGEQSPLPLRRAYFGDGAAVAAAAGAFCVVEVLLPIFFDRLRTFAPFLRWLFGITIILSVMVCSYGVEVLRGSGPVPVMTPALPLPRPPPAVLPVVPVPLICPFASLQMKDPAQTPTKMICESLDKFISFG
jgi:hypothetical protein